MTTGIREGNERSVGIVSSTKYLPRTFDFTTRMSSAVTRALETAYYAVIGFVMVFRSPRNCNRSMILG